MAFLHISPKFFRQSVQEAVMGALSLPVDYFSLAKQAIDATSDLIAASSDETPSVETLDSVIRMADNALICCDINDRNLIYILYVLHSQVVVLHCRYAVLRHEADLDRCVHISELMRHFCDPTNILLLSHVVCAQMSCLWLRSQHEVTKNRLHPPPDFIDFAPLTVQKAHELSQISPESRDPSYQIQVIRDLDSVIAMVDEMIEHYEPDTGDTEDLAYPLYSQGIALRARFKLSGDIADLDRATLALGAAFNSCDPSAPDRLYDISREIERVLTLHYARTQDPTELDDLIEMEEWLASQPSSTNYKEKLSMCTTLSQHLLIRSSTKENVEDSNRVVQLCKDLFPFGMPEEHSEWLAFHGCALLLLSRYGARLEDWNGALKTLERAFGDTTPHTLGEFLLCQLRTTVTVGDRNRADDLELEFVKLSQRYKNPFIRLASTPRNLSDAQLDDTIIAFKRRLSPSHNNDEPKPASTLVLLVALCARYERSYRVQDFRDMLVTRSAPYLAPLGTYCLDIGLVEGAKRDINPLAIKAIIVETMNTHTALGDSGCYCLIPDKRTYDSAESLGFIEIRGHWQSMAGGVIGDSRMALSFSAPFTHIGNVLSDSESDTHTPIAAAAHSGCDAAKFRTPNQQRLSTLIADHIQAWDPNDLTPRGIEHLEKAILYSRQLLDTVEEDDQSPDVWDCRVNWAQLLFSKHTTFTQVPYSQLLLAHDYLRKAVCEQPYFFHYQRLIFANHWFRGLTYGMRKDRGVHTKEMSDLTLSLLEEQSWVASSVRSSVDTRYWIQGLIGSMVSALPIDFDHLPRIAEILESGQSLVWNQLNRLEPLGSLQKLTLMDPELASRFQNLSVSLERRQEPSREKFGSDPFGISRWQTYQERKQILEEIRALPGFEDFSKPRQFDDLMGSTCHGPIVIFVPHRKEERSSALILYGSVVASLLVPMSYGSLCDFHQALHTSTRGRSDLVDDEAPTTMDPPPSPTLDSDRSLRRNIRDKSKMDLFLEKLWNDFAEPTIRRVMQIMGDSDGAALKKPKREDRRRIWWYCVGKSSFLPIHAAGIYHGSSPICVSDFFVSSYIPSLGALIDARKRPLPKELKVLAAVQPYPGQGWSRLPEAANELMEVLAIVPASNLIHLAPSNEPDIEGLHTTVQNVLSKLPEANVLHLACHGTQDTADPVTSGFILANGERLTVEDLAKHQFPNAHTAILSACHTADNDIQQPEESIGLANAMMFLGFRSILATKWPMYDADGPVIAKAVYTELFRGTRGSQPPQVGLKLLIDSLSSVLSRPLETSELLKISKAIMTHVVTNKPDPTEDNLLAMLHESIAEIGLDLSDSEMRAIEGFVRKNFELLVEESPFSRLSLAHVVDDIVRDLRVSKKLPSSRWATFVHIGI